MKIKTDDLKAPIYRKTNVNNLTENKLLLLFFTVLSYVIINIYIIKPDTKF